MAKKVFGGWECTICGKQFAYAWAVVKHEAKHAEDLRVGGVGE